MACCFMSQLLQMLQAVLTSIGKVLLDYLKGIAVHLWHLTLTRHCTRQTLMQRKAMGLSKEKTSQELSVIASMARVVTLLQRAEHTDKVTDQFH